MDLSAAELLVIFTVRFERQMLCCTSNLLDAGHHLQTLRREYRTEEFLADILASHYRGVAQILGIETIIAQVVVENLVCREVVCVVKSLYYLCHSDFECRLAQEILVCSIAQMAHGADRENDLFVGQNTSHQLVIHFHYLLDRKPVTREFRGGLLVAIGYNLAALVEGVDPRCAEGY